jgi:hypothetical protein
LISSWWYCLLRADWTMTLCLHGWINPLIESSLGGIIGKWLRHKRWGLIGGSRCLGCVLGDGVSCPWPLLILLSAFWLVLVNSSVPPCSSTMMSYLTIVSETREPANHGLNL